MAKRSTETFAKRQKEFARKEKQQRKTAKRLERRRLGPAGAAGEGVEGDPENPDAMGVQEGEAVPEAVGAV